MSLLPDSGFIQLLIFYYANKIIRFPKKERIDFTFFLCFWLDPKAPKDQARR